MPSLFLNKTETSKYILRTLRRTRRPPISVDVFRPRKARFHATRTMDGRRDAGKNFQWDQSDEHTRNEIATESGRNESLVSCIRKRRCRLKGIERPTFPSIDLPRMIVKLPERLRLATKLASVGRRSLVERSRFDVRTAEEKREKRPSSR